MPKGKKKKGKKSVEPHVGVGMGGERDGEEYDPMESASVASIASSGGQASDTAASLAELGAGADASNQVDDLSAQEQFEEKLKDAIDGLIDKSAKTRLINLKNLNNALCKKYLPDFVTDRKITICDSLERCLKKGKGEEQVLAAVNMVLLCIQLGMGYESETIYNDIKPLLTTILLDKTASAKARASCGTALGMSTFLASNNLEQVQEVMQTLESVFKASYFKGDGVPPVHSPEVGNLHCCALAVWSMLLSIAPGSVVEHAVDKILNRLPEMLQSTQVDLRIEAGQAIALCYELAREQDQEFERDDMDDLCETLKQLATDSQKFRAKKDRQKQRFSFREIMRAVEEGESPEISIKFGLETVYIDSWVKKCQYDALASVLGSGTNTHLQENCLVREIFGLGEPISTMVLDKMKSAKVSKVERHSYNMAAFKARTKLRQKFRDKRSAVFPS